MAFYSIAAKDSKSLLKKPFLGQTQHRSPVTPPFMASHAYRGRAHFNSHMMNSYQTYQGYQGRQAYRGNQTRGRPYGTKGISNFTFGHAQLTLQSKW